MRTGCSGGLQVNQPWPFRAYLQAPDKTSMAFTADGWLITGDFGTMDAQGRVKVLGCGAALIVTGGLNVYPKEVEEHLNRLPGVVDSAVIGVPHEEYGEAVLAVVEVGEHEGALTEGGMRDILRRSLTGYKVPKRVVIVTTLPRNALGKVKKQALRDRYQSHFGAAKSDANGSA